MDRFYFNGAFHAWDRLTEAGFRLWEVGLTEQYPSADFRIEMEGAHPGTRFVGEGLTFREALVVCLGTYLRCRFHKV